MPEMPPVEGAVRRVVHDGFEIDVSENDRFLLAEKRCDGIQVVTGFATHSRLVRHFVKRSTQSIMCEEIESSHIMALLGLVLSNDGSGLMQFPPLTHTHKKSCQH